MFKFKLVMVTFSEENYLKAIYHLSRHGNDSVSTNAIANKIQTKASSVTDMIKKLADKELVNYKKYQGVELTKKGRLMATTVIRKHRLWEVFLVEKLDFSWDEVHEIAEQLEHIRSEKLTERLDSFLNFPTVDPHGDPIPDKDGVIHAHKNRVLSDLKPGETGIIVGVKEHAPSFLQYLEKNQLLLGSKVKVLNHFDFDHSLVIEANGNERTVSHQVSKNLYVAYE